MGGKVRLSSETDRMMQRLLGRSLLAATLLTLAPAASGARAADAVAFKFVLDIELGTSVTEGIVPVIGNRFAISEITWFKRVDLSGELAGNRARVTGDWNGSYMAGDCEIVDGRCQITFRTTGTIYSAFLSLTVH